ncbi:MAG: DUF882 domain-containing protein [Elusimicrobiales bacterium]|nr:DUF882 domain-containing protein [Elusimicrobiales bacterium]
MSRSAAFAAAILPLFFSGPGRCSAADKEISASEFIENFSSLLDLAPEPPMVTEAEVIELEEGDVQTYIFVRGAAAHPPPPVNLGGDGRLALNRPDTGERIVSAYRNGDETYNQAELDKIQRLMRCRQTDRETAISIKLLEILDLVEDRFGKGGLTILSGYRSPKFNKKLPGAARWSTHMLGWAADIRVPGHSTAEVADFAAKMHEGGVGFYPDAAFVHLDSSRPRHWEVRKKSRPAPDAKTPAPHK